MPRPKRGRHTSWKESASRSKKKSKSTAKWVLTSTGVFLGLILGVILVILFLTQRGETYVVEFNEAETDSGILPPIRFGREDYELLNPESNEDSFLKISRARLSSLSGDFGATQDWASNDRLIVVVRAHGVSIGDQAVLLTRSFDPTNFDAELFEASGPSNGTCILVSDLLKTIRGCTPRTKIVIFDTGHILADDRLGLVANQFQRLLQKEFEALEESADVWGYRYFLPDAGSPNTARCDRQPIRQIARQPSHRYERA